MNGTSKCQTREGWLSPPIDLGIFLQQMKLRVRMIITILLQEDEEQDNDNDHHGDDHVWMMHRRRI